MSPRDEKSQRALECFKLVKRTFIITFLLVFVTTAVMYGTTQNISIQTSRVIESNFKPMPIINRTFIQTVFKLGHKINTTNTSKTYTEPKMPSGAAIIIQQTGEPTTVLSQPKPARFDVPNPLLIAQLDASLNKKLPAKVTDLVRLKPGSRESPEFPGMPDACQTPRRNTGVEDVLCMVGNYRYTSSLK